ncbi:hypothetical protein IDM40_00135 [Nocardiopsis sp. HNM0947]|uniref:Uncharacterized protein n=1 Tax=Nocardiopsis coralli TaxID=2772213 RepID=A0ABR9NZU9_9ACTN|nr:DUF6221 family protein [Nocardiopsis coralli]MBE2997113.1 hypothetical protein [Nocardiopsis coralli]
MDALVSFVRARIDERWRAALDAGASTADRRWSAGEDRVDTAAGDRVARTEGGAAESDRARSAHIAGHDPDRVLEALECERRLLERYELLSAGLVRSPDEEALLAEYRDLVLPLLALPFADHPDHRREWLPR